MLAIYLLRSDGMRYPLFFERPLPLIVLWWRRYRPTKLFHSVSDGRRDLFPTGIGETHVQHTIAVPRGHADGLIHHFQNIGLDQVALAQDANARAVPVEQVAVLDELLEFDLGHVHQRVHLVFRALEVFNAERVDRDMRYPGLVAYFEDLVGTKKSAAVWLLSCGGLAYPGQRFEPQVMSFHRLDPVFLCKPSVPVHHECHMIRHRPLAQGPNEQFSQLVQCPFGRRRG